MGLQPALSLFLCAYQVWLRARVLHRVCPHHLFSMLSSSHLLTEVRDLFLLNLFLHICSVCSWTLHLYVNFRIDLLISVKKIPCLGSGWRRVASVDSLGRTDPSCCLPVPLRCSPRSQAALLLSVGRSSAPRVTLISQVLRSPPKL